MIPHADGCPILALSRLSCVPGGLWHCQHSRHAGQPEPELGAQLAGRRSLLVATLATLGLLLAACSLTGALVESAGLTRKLGEQGYTSPNVNVGFNASGGVRSNTLTVTVDRPPTPPAEDAAAAGVATFVIDNYSRIGDVDVLAIVLNTAGSERKFTRSPQEWRDYVAAMNQPPGISGAVTARGTFGEKYEPRDVTVDFGPDQPVFHAVVSIRNLPAGSLVKAVWVAVDTHGDSQPNMVMTATEARVEGSRNIDFTLEPSTGRLPRGRYKVDIHLGEKLERTLPFTVAGG